MADKNFKIWGMSYGVIGDLIMGLPMLTYFEKKHPGSYKYWVIEKKCAISAPLYFNHPLIDRIKITDEWSGFGSEDKRLSEACSVATTCEGWQHDRKDWYNVRSCVEETARIAGIEDIKDVLTEEELKPKLYKWFDVGEKNPHSDTYSKVHDIDNSAYKHNIAIWPFASGSGKGRSPSVEWWGKLVDELCNIGYTVSHYGRSTEPWISNHKNYTRVLMPGYFEQAKMSLASKMCIGTDSGSMWVMGAYSHPAINLLTNWMPKHESNFMALAPVNDNATNLFAEGGCDNIPIDKVLETITIKVRRI